MDIPDVHYARAGGVAIAYQAVGEGPETLVFSPQISAGIAVVTGARISSLAAPGEVLVSSTVKDLVAGSGFSFAERGEHELKDVPGTWRLHAVVAA
jgi:class 3 adenylate cyclase